MTIGYTINVGNFASLKVSIEGERGENQPLDDLRKEMLTGLEIQLSHFAVNSEARREMIEAFLRDMACDDQPIEHWKMIINRMHKMGSVNVGNSDSW